LVDKQTDKPTIQPIDDFAKWRYVTVFVIVIVTISVPFGLSICGLIGVRPDNKSALPKIRRMENTKDETSDFSFLRAVFETGFGWFCGD
jgi:hypothetical protein